MHRRFAPIVSAFASLALLTPIHSATPPESDIIQRTRSKEYQLDLDLFLIAYQHDRYAEVQVSQNLKDTPLVFPIVPDGGFHTVDMNRVEWRFELDDRPVRTEVKILDVGKSDSKLARFIIEEFDGKQIDLHSRQFITSYDAVVDEKRAAALPWPTENFPEHVHAELQPQMYIESTSEKVHNLMNSWTNSKPKNMPPFLLGKYLAKHVVQYYQVSGKEWTNDNYGSLVGIEVFGAEHAVEHARGPLNDAVCLYVAVCRAAGLPARPVIGFDTEERDELTTWAEYYVPGAGWVSVDFRRLYKAPGMMHDLWRAWPGVGTNNELHELVPFTHHFHPPAYVMAGGRLGRPLFWGWVPRPEGVPTDQRMSYKVMVAPKRGGG